MKHRAGVPTVGIHLILALHEGAEPRAVTDAANRLKVKAHLLFSHSREQLCSEADRCEADMHARPPDLSLAYRVRVRPERMREVASRLRAVGEVAAAYIMPAVALPTDDCSRLKARKDPAPVPTPPLVGRQGYLNPGDAGGVDARHAWTLPGGRGENVHIVHIEGAWNFAHEDLLRNIGGGLGSQVQDPCARQHGTSVLGVLGADVGSVGVNGICPRALIRTIAVAWDRNPDLTELPAAIRRAANALRPGDIILVELQHPGPEVDFRFNEERRGFIPSEWWPATFMAVRYATTKGIIVVEAAGNGDVNLDAPIYNEPHHFPATWKNPFGRATAESDSGAILVGAGAPPSEPHGKGVEAGVHGADRSRLEFSNFGSAVDAQAWGREVTTCGYGSLQGGSQENRWYTDNFGGTSSASPIVAGVLACVQGILKAKGAPLMTPAQARKLLRNTGWPQADRQGTPAAKEPIGSRPDLKELVRVVLSS
jgi:hypothetical protein